MSMTLTGLRCLVQIVDANLSITAASQTLHMSQPCVSRHLKQVEDSLGFRVFTRRGRGLMDVTQPGHEAIEVARRVVRDVERLRRFASSSDEDAGELTIAAPQTYALHVLPPMLGRLRASYPGLSVSMQTLGEGERVHPEDHRHCDIVVVSTAGDDVPDGTAVPLFRWKRVVTVPHDHPLAEQRSPVTLAQLAAWPLVTYEASRRPQSSLRRVFAGAGLEPRFSCSAHDAATLKAYTRAGLGVGLLAELSIDGSDHRDLAVLQVDPVIPHCTAWAVLPEGRLVRNPTLDLVRLLAPQVDADLLRRAARGVPPARWPEPPVYC